jgi:Ca2+-binding EF-hand superfamily protein
LNANGFHEFIRWIDATDAFLVLDVNENGIIDDGSELFGDSMLLPNGSRALCGFDALRAFDSDNDGKVGINDEIFASLKLLTGAGQLV